MINTINNILALVYVFMIGFTGMKVYRNDRKRGGSVATSLGFGIMVGILWPIPNIAQSLRK